MALAANYLYFHVLILLSTFIICKSDTPDCVYTVYVKTGTKENAGTDSTINLGLLDAYGNGFEMYDIKGQGGLMGPGHNYFEAENIDIFSIVGSCLANSICLMYLRSDGKGYMPGWYVEYVDVFTASKIMNRCDHEYFTVNEWLVLDEPPYNLTLYRDNCVSSKKNQMMNGLDVSLSSIV
ncbi:UNVERIFIED_CONTAM: PLAT domain-containing protein 2 [Sesamum radiatum]|uniref:PLAT domain-containing protein 2 n=1 Tax=Sesamum radiatum TaxID=300843 RepID=A0AAW2T4T0_SESRA